jgi:lipid II:glycine glycyltransferase (peptidoglycan interpeptide bridge formation enzyme)
MDKDFLQSDQWRKFQEAAGRRAFLISENNFQASIIEHKLPIVGKYFYIPRGPATCHPELVSGSNSKLDSGSEAGMTKVIELAKKNNIGWIRFDPVSEKITELIQELTPELKIKKAPHDMQPKEVFVINIKKPEEQLLAEMKPKTRYNIKVAQKHDVRIIPAQAGMKDRYIEEFLKLVKITAKRDKITPHPENYYRKMFETIPVENLKLYLAEYENKIIAANIVVFYGKTATYLHGASDNAYRNVMATYLLQWQAMLDAKAIGCEKYDMGGVSTNYESNTNIRITNNWAGITRFKTGFSTTTKPLEFSGSYDIVINPFRYNLYRILQWIRALF